MEPKTFDTNSPGQLIHVGQGELAYWAFMPNPLPPSIALENRLWIALSEADRALGELAGLGRIVPNPHLLIQPFIRREAVLSSRIEGTQASLSDLYAFEAEQLAFPMLDSSATADVREVYNYVRALEYGLAKLDELPVSLRWIREIHRQLMEGVRGEQMTPGEFRRSQNWIGIPGCALRDATFVPPPVEQMQEALHQLENYLHVENSYPPLIRLAFLHYQFEAIHPFLDGNGRIGRLLIVLLLVHWGLLSAPLLYLSAYFEHHRSQYYDSLLGVTQSGKWVDWLVFFLQGIQEQARDATARARELLDLRERWTEMMQATRATSLMYQVVDLLVERPILTANQVVDRCHMTHPAAMKTLRRLEAIGIVRQAGTGRRNLRFVADDIINIIS